MKRVVLYLLLLNGFFAAGQESKPECHDVVRLKTGSVFRGRIITYDPSGEMLMHTWSGIDMHFPSGNIKKVVQKCRYAAPGKPVNVPFKTQGWYHFTRFELLMGKENLGYGLQHSSGYRWNRWASLGFGLGAEEFNPGNYPEPTTFPAFAEFRGYLSSKKVSPTYSFGTGYGFTRKKGRSDVILDGPTETWKGGWMGQLEMGYRIGNYAMIQLGIRFQYKTRDWQSIWSADFHGTDHIVHKRFQISAGILI